MILVPMLPQLFFLRLRRLETCLWEQVWSWDCRFPQDPKSDLGSGLDNFKLFKPEVSLQYLSSFTGLGKLRALSPEL